MQIELNSLYWPGTNPEVPRIHRACFQHIGVPVKYTEKRIRHGRWMDRVIAERMDRDGIVAFVDIDALAYSRAAVENTFRYVEQTKSFLGLAQSSNHLQTRMRIFAAPCFLVISKHAFDALGRPSMMPTKFGDVAQELSTRADATGFPYRTLYPIGFREMPPHGTPWRLGNYGHFGIGTEYEGGFFHNYFGREGKIDTISEVAAAIMEDRAQPAALQYVSRDDKFWTEVSEKAPAPERRLQKWARKFRRVFTG
ncbi:MAG: hypothetical protein JNK47_17380 [Mesorhizobium sp.]|nr:hypothetical protein [Mesorhizobium sp.]MBL8578994.1 hypothetical protein [Mesorhizobium sp.]